MPHEPDPDTTTALEAFFSPPVVALALLHVFAHERKAELAQTKTMVLALHALASERRELRVTAAELSLSPSLVVPVAALPEHVMQSLEAMAAHLEQATTFPVQVLAEHV